MESVIDQKPGHVTSLVEADSIVIRFSGDSGDGMQLTGTQFTDTAAFFGKDISTFPEFPAEIRAPIGTTAGVSGFQVHFGSKEIFTPGDEYDVLVAMNSAALKVDLHQLKKGGIVIVNTAGFDKKNLGLAGYADGANPLEDGTLEGYTVHKIDVTKFTKECLAGSSLGMKEIERSKNMFVLGLLFWMFDESMDHTIAFINEKFAKKPDIAEANIKTLKAGWNYGDHTEIFVNRYKVAPAKLPKGVYRNISGNAATAIGLVAAAELSGLPLFLGSYPITPASDVLHELAKYKTSNVKTFQAEDEIAAICAAIGASYAGGLGVTTTSGPGMALKTEALGLATILEIPLLVIDIQRGGPSTGLPTKTEQSDLMQAMYGRHGEGPLPVIAACSPSDCFDTILEAARIATEHMTPVIVLTDGYIANGSEPWRFPAAADLKPFKVNFVTENNNPGGTFKPYKRDEKLSRPWVKPGTKELMHRIGGLEKQNETGNVSYDAKNHETMTRIRAEKIQKIADYIPLAKPDSGKDKGKLVVLGWGSTSGAIKTAVREAIAEGYDVSHVHLQHINPFPKNLGELLSNYDNLLIPEMNCGQLLQLIRAKYLLPAIGLSKVQGLPFTTSELKNKILEILKS
ncbi:MAG: 2-oxoacid:acceptor oxidoreductase subunit alpha [Flavipsychrobacter sp.]|jgi:2-oxoglutarate ferredoxin oxidoreductase subunit alpha|nr:2-oxoacid:acceptor oxidoreductase subunit alpha [Flavipsychrobacter sp.]